MHIRARNILLITVVRIPKQSCQRLPQDIVENIAKLLQASTHYSSYGTKAVYCQKFANDVVQNASFFILIKIKFKLV